VVGGSGKIGRKVNKEKTKGVKEDGGGGGVYVKISVRLLCRVNRVIMVIRLLGLLGLLKPLGLLGYTGCLCSTRYSSNPEGTRWWLWRWYWWYYRV
jgi:hypothetical protein